MSDRRHVWRASWAARVYWTVLGVVVVVMACLPSRDGPVTFPLDGSGSIRDGMGYRLLGVAAVAFWLCRIYRARMELRSDELVLRYTLTTRVIPLHAIASVTPGRAGLVIETDDGARYGSPAFIGEKAPVATWLRRSTRADGIADLIMRRPHA